MRPHIPVQGDGLVEPVAGRCRAALGGEEHGGVRQGLRAPQRAARGSVVGRRRQHRCQIGGQQPTAVVGHGALDRHRFPFGLVRRGPRGRGGSVSVADGEREPHQRREEQVPGRHAYGGALVQARGEHRHRVIGPACPLRRHRSRKVQVMAVPGGSGGPAPLLGHGSEVFPGRVAVVPVAGYQGEEPVREG